MGDRLKILFITRLFSPFQIEVANAVNADPGIDFRIAFTIASREGRKQPHWRNFDYDRSRHPIMPDGCNAVPWLVETIRQTTPDVLISGQFLLELYQAVLATWRDERYTLAFWSEPLDATKPPLRRAAALQGTRFRLAFADLILAIGYRAEREFAACAPQADVTLVPYGQDLSDCFAATEEEKRSEVMRFVFSGQLLDRHNIALLMQALVELSRVRPGKFELTFSGHGPEQATIDAVLQQTPALQSAVRFDSDFNSWSERVRPLRRAHVLVYPTKYAGWGLVVPEGMAAGLPILSTPQAEAAQYFVRHRVNGAFVDPTVASWVREMCRCIDYPDEVREMGRRARGDAIDGHAPMVAKRLVQALVRSAGRSQRENRRALSAWHAQAKLSQVAAQLSKLRQRPTR
jgi:glycosyltransferase involved in cell wall biosynthesis